MSRISLLLTCVSCVEAEKNTSFSNAVPAEADPIGLQ